MFTPSRNWLALSCVVILGLSNGLVNPPGSAAGETAFDSVVNDFDDANKCAFGAIVKIGYDPIGCHIRVGAAAHIGVSPAAYDKYVFTISVTSRDASGTVVATHQHVMDKPYSKGDSYKWGVYTTHMNPKPGKYEVTATLTATSKDGKISILLDRGKVTSYTVK